MAEEKKISSWVPTNPLYDPAKPMQVGGQAVIEGVMMRAPGSVATAVRRANGDIVVKQEKYASVVEKYKILKLPVLRGAIGLIDMMYLGIRTLNYSAEIAMLDVEEKKHPVSGNGETKTQSKLALAGTLVLALALSVAIFFVLPILVTTKVFHFEQSAFEFNLVAGLIRITILLGYLSAIALSKEIQRLFQFHGAEHKTVFAFELTDQLIPRTVQERSRFHPRCGTSFLLIVMFVAILAFGLLDAVTIALVGKITIVTRLLTHLPFIPVVGGISYEVIKFSAKHTTTWWGRMMIAPGLWLQRVTTREPDESQLEVAIVALRCALGLEDPAKYTLRDPLPVEEATVASGN
ncbi:MAG: DUF1385 domain-containing protein [Ignavibacteriales bacterium]|nr:DUF1385 domain-containing protein [Ignavibacteriales bacterium]